MGFFKSMDITAPQFLFLYVWVNGGSCILAMQGWFFIHEFIEWLPQMPAAILS
jgi:hypothetical protein